MYLIFFSLNFLWKLFLKQGNLSISTIVFINYIFRTIDQQQDALISQIKLDQELDEQVR